MADVVCSKAWINYFIQWKKLAKVATPWPASAPPMTPSGEEAAASAAYEAKHCLIKVNIKNKACI